MNTYRSHNCGEITINDVDKEITISGWINKKRDHGGLLFLDIRDNYGITQCVIDNEHKLFNIAESLRTESVVKIVGIVIKRTQETINKSILTGEIEIKINLIDVLNSSEVVPFQISVDDDTPEEMRLRYRYLDLRKKKIHENILLRSKVINFLRNKMIENDFTEIQTPILTSSSPEGARDFLIPSRLQKGKFYALPQAPQIFKQLLMIGGFDKYFQIAPCFRDEDARADRSPGEFYQLDFEMSFVNQEDIFNTIEPVIFELFDKFSNNKRISDYPFTQIKYKDSLENFGTDKPDLRNPLIINDFTEDFDGASFKIFSENIKKGFIVKGIKAPKTSNYPRAWFDKLNDWARNNGQKGLGYIIFEENRGKGPIANNLSEENTQKIRKKGNLVDGDSIFFVCDQPKVAKEFSGIVREKICDELNLREKDCFKFCWIVDFPMFEVNKETNKIDFSHNPFSMPQGGMNSLINKHPLDILAWQFDIVCNGIELSSGAIRNHKSEIMLKAFEIAGYSEKELKERFGAVYEAFNFGAPPHGGSAPGIDRILMLLADERNLREVVAFPLNQQAEDLMLGAPTFPSQKHLKELKIKIARDKHE